jgi:hypothetical protein
LRYSTRKICTPEAETDLLANDCYDTQRNRVVRQLSRALNCHAKRKVVVRDAAAVHEDAP